MISYEIFFASEVGHRLKQAEVMACRDLCFALVQDPERGLCLSEENAISPEDLVYMPVAGRGTRPQQRGKLRASLGIPDGMKIAIHIGSTDSWTLLNDLIDTIPRWPDDWCLVVHPRYPATDAPWLASARRFPERVFLSPGSLPALDDLSQLLGDADVGLALYRPTFDTAFTGLNLLHLGFSSGKLSSYLQHGIPVVTNIKGSLADSLVSCQAGHIVSAVDEIPGLLSRVEHRNESITHRCLSFFARELDADARAAPFLLEVARCVRLAPASAECGDIC